MNNEKSTIFPISLRGGLHTLGIPYKPQNELSLLSFYLKMNPGGGGVDGGGGLGGGGVIVYYLLCFYL